MTIEGASPLQQALYDAIEANDVVTFNALARQVADIAAEFDSWMTVPAAIRADQNAASRYVESLITIAQAFEAVGEPSLLERLVGPDEANPVLQWNRRLSRAQALSEAGEYADSNTQLAEILAEMEGATGTAVVSLRPKILGRLGFNALHEQEYATALDYTEQAYDASLAADDEEGLVAYYENLMSLRVIQALHAEPELGQLLLEVRRLIARAQDSADAGRYRASIDTLSQAISMVKSREGDDLFRALLPKIYGLLGLSEYRLGNTPKAREHSVLALTESESIGDADGVRIYGANLAAIDS